MSGFGNNGAVPQGPFFGGQPNPAASPNQPLSNFRFGSSVGTNSTNTQATAFSATPLSTGLSFGSQFTQSPSLFSATSSVFQAETNTQQTARSIFESSSSVVNNNMSQFSSARGFGNIPSTAIGSNSNSSFGFGTSSNLLSSSNASTSPFGAQSNTNTFSINQKNSSVFGQVPKKPFSSQGISSLSTSNNENPSIFTHGSSSSMKNPISFSSTNTSSFSNSPFTTSTALTSFPQPVQNTLTFGGHTTSVSSTLPFGFANDPLRQSKHITMMDDEEDMMGTYESSMESDAVHSFTQPQQTVAQEKKEEELARLKAKIAEKRRLLKEKQQRVEASASTATDLDTSITFGSPDNVAPLPLSTISSSTSRTLNPHAASFVPRTFGFTEKSKEQPTSVLINSNPLPRLPSKPVLVNNTQDGDDLDREFRPVSMAQSLIGTCPYMCPEEEWLRRESEGDVQILEMPHPSIHPKDWTLRETAVKRFRRSAADYKLDIPSLVRPPHVLEQVCAYLEEWVMERDRQGVDPRYVNMGKGNIPPSLDVYLFIWDRTRMIRKDFILQNFVGTGGRCSATAVRVHERIARWHAMCEHQLSHLADFIPQSQQNIQELGQTMKTLNLYYDDVLGRSTKEEDNYVYHQHGCSTNVVMGSCPVDYNGQILDNSQHPISSSGRRIIGGDNGSVSATSEPEMRALYILLTANNDGGMEVLKYAGRLSVERPDVFKSAPVKLSMEIFMAKKEYNYAKFFSLLKSKRTPYLFACIMFKYVEQMREVAFRMMSKTFGSRKKDSLEHTCDSYPLIDLVHLLCFEDSVEAKEACEHYSIIVENVGNVETVLWKKSEFSKPRDPTKGTIIHLRPWKMVRVIESKLHGATRLAICRGDLSHIEPLNMVQEDSPSIDSLGTQKKSLLSKSSSPNEPPSADVLVRPIELRQKDGEDKESYQRRIDEALNKSIQEAAIKERLRQDEVIRQEKKKEEARLLELQKEDAMRRLAIEREEMMRKVREEELERHRIMQLIEQQNKEKEARRLQELREKELRDRMEEECRQRLMAEEIRKQVEKENDAKNKILRDRLESERRQKLAEEIMRKQRYDLEWIERISTARKVIVLKKWQRALHRNRATHRLVSLQCTSDPTSCRFPLTPAAVAINNNRLADKLSTNIIDYNNESRKGILEGLFYRLGTDVSRNFDFGSLFQKFDSGQRSSLSPQRYKHKLVQSGTTFLCKIGYYVCGNSKQTPLSKWIDLWLNSRLHGAASIVHSSPYRTVVVDCSNCMELIESCDAALILITPMNESYDNYSFPQLQSLVSCDIPRVILNLDTLENLRYTEEINRFVKQLYHSDGGYGVLNVGDALLNDCSIDEDLLLCIEALIEEYIHRTSNRLSQKLVERLPIHIFSSLLFRKILCLASIHPDSEDVISAHVQRSLYVDLDERMLNDMKTSILLVIDEMESLYEKLGTSPFKFWPSNEFLDSDCLVPDYFSDSSGLPSTWRQSLKKLNVEKCLRDYLPSLFDSSSTLFSFLDDLCNEAPVSVKEECVSLLQNEQFFEACDLALKWSESHSVNRFFLYLPVGETSSIIDRICDRMFPSSSFISQPYPIVNIKQNENLVQLQAAEKVLETSQTEQTAMKHLVQLQATEKGLETSQTIVKNLCRVSSKKLPNYEAAVAPNNKRQRFDKPRSPAMSTLEVDASKAFTAKLQALLKEETLFDMNIGDTTLSRILTKQKGSV